MQLYAEKIRCQLSLLTVDFKIKSYSKYGTNGLIFRWSIKIRAIGFICILNRLIQILLFLEKSLVFEQNFARYIYR